MTRLRPWMLVTLAALVYALAVVARGGTLALVTIGERFADGDPALNEGSEGYDGQFTYYIARDPDDAARFLDVPGYRFQRILLPALGRALALGQTDLLPWALLLVNLVALAAGTWLLEHLLEQYGASCWYALGYGLAIGALGAARLSLPEPLAYALALGGIWQHLKGRVLVSAVLFALAALAKETALILAAGAGLSLLWERRRRDAMVFGIVALLPFATWQVILLDRLGEMGVGSGGAMATSFEIVPFGGVIRIWTEGGLTAFLALGVLLLPFVLVPTLWGPLTAWRDVRHGRIDMYTWLLAASAIAMLFVPFSTYREPLGILRFVVGLQLAVMLHAAARQNQRVLLNSTIWALSSLLLIGSDLAGSGPGS